MLISALHIISNFTKCLSIRLYIYTPSRRPPINNTTLKPKPKKKNKEILIQNIIKHTKWRQRTADRAARAAGTVYRVVAGTESLGINMGAQKSIQSEQLNLNDDYTTRTITDGLSDGVKCSPFKLNPFLCFLFFFFFSNLQITISILLYSLHISI